MYRSCTAVPGSSDPNKYIANEVIHPPSFYAGEQRTGMLDLVQDSLAAVLFDKFQT